MNKNVLSHHPIGYITAKELWDKYAKKKFEKLKAATCINDYYDFIFAAGAVGNWLIYESKKLGNEKLKDKLVQKQKEEIYQIFNSIYNNTKHYELKEKYYKHYEVYIENYTTIPSLQSKSLLSIPDKAKIDCFHLATCVVAKIEYLLSWNCTHLGMHTFSKIQKYNIKQGLYTPLLITPEALLEIREE